MASRIDKLTLACNSALSSSLATKETSNLPGINKIIGTGDSEKWRRQW
ncbi:hypothetical protein EYZ11_010159 [Aspergillus tanneri]|uniref:Uncharacterized protein n=1 Tax=Aspergillus tanneri TaxID=1220188 RepID=A0A4S3J855_9EURO|nr:hypothetical protein EYZ11_010159 [Aspergillus tanneri]